MIDNLPKELKYEITSYLNLECHTCKVKFKSLIEISKIYKKQSKFIYCSKECYEFF